jgi:hypothetical protein
MYNNEDIYSRLLAGESGDDIAAEMTKALNDALDRIAAEEKARREEEERKMREAAEREAKNAAKHGQLADIITDTLYFCAEFYPSLGITTEEVDQMSDETIDALADMFLMLLDVELAKKTRQTLNTAMKLGPMDFLFNTPKITVTTDDKITTTEPVAKADKKPSNDDIFASFFKNFM